MWLHGLVVSQWLIKDCAQTPQASKVFTLCCWILVWFGEYSGIPILLTSAFSQGPLPSSLSMRAVFQSARCMWRASTVLGHPCTCTQPPSQPGRKEKSLSTPLWPLSFRISLLSFWLVYQSATPSTATSSLPCSFLTKLAIFTDNAIEYRFFSSHPKSN